MQEKIIIILKRVTGMMLFIITGFLAMAQQPGELAGKVWKGLGGKEVWEESRYFMFSCIPVKQNFTDGEQAYLWDRNSGSCRLDSQTPEGQSLTVLFNTHNSTARVYLDGILIRDGEITADYARKSAAAFQNNAYWLFIPGRLEESRLLSGGEELVDAKKYDILQMASQSGQTGIRKGRLYIDSHTGKIEKWVAQDSNGNTVYDFKLSAFKDIGGGLLLATQLYDSQRHIRISYTIAASLMHIEADKFSKP